MSNLESLQNQFNRVIYELSGMHPADVDDFKRVYQYHRRRAHLERERGRLEALLELERVTIQANYSNELSDRTI